MYRKSAGVRSAGGGLLDSVRAQFGTVVDVEFLEDVREVGFDRRGRDEHPFADLGVGETLSDELDDFGFGRGERSPAAGWAPAGATRPASPFESVVDAQLRALEAGGGVGVLAERVVEL